MKGKESSIPPISNKNIDPLNPQISNEKFELLAKYIKNEYGIVLNETKKSLVVNRVFKRINSLNLASIDDYLDFAFSDSGRKEKDKLGDLLSTNKTYFFRENEHFDFIKHKIIKLGTSLDIWCSACSSGEEAYSIAMILKESSPTFSILANDISKKSLDLAKAGEFHENQLWTTPNYYLKRYFKKIEKPIGIYYQIDLKLQQNIRFEYFNLIKDQLNNFKKFDFIFCRNVLIYFDTDTKIKVINSLIKHLKTDGYLILGSTEGFIGNELGLKQIQPSIFQAR